MLEQPSHRKPEESNGIEVDNGAQESDSERLTWPQRILQKLRRFVRRPGGVTWAVLLLVAAVLGRSYRKRISSAVGLTIPYSSSRKRFDYRNADESALSHLWEAIRNKLVQKVLLSGSSSIVYYKAKNNQGAWRRTRLPPNQPQMVKDVMERLSEAGCSDVQVLPESLISRFASPFVAALPFIYLGLLYRMVQHFSNQHSSISSDSTSSSKTDASTRQSNTTFADVAGLDSILPDVSEIVHYLQNPTAFRALGARPPRGILLYGPPGCGKTLLARAVAGEAAVDAFVACNASDFVEVFVGRGAARVRHLFQQLRQQARAAATRAHWWQRLWSTCVKDDNNINGGGGGGGGSANNKDNTHRPATALLFIDELDALAKTRSVLSSSDEREQTLMQLLTEMDGFSTRNDDGDKNPPVTIVVLAASNRADVLDPAILRRFDRHIHVDYPDAQGRQAILQRHARGVRLEDSKTGACVDWAALAAMSPGMSGSDLRNVVNEAALLAVRSQSSAVRQTHFEQAIHKHKKARASSQRSTLAQFVPLIGQERPEETILLRPLIDDDDNESS